MITARQSVSRGATQEGGVARASNGNTLDSCVEDGSFVDNDNDKLCIVEGSTIRLTPFYTKKNSKCAYVHAVRV